MNVDILQGAWLETQGRVKEKWSKFMDNELGEIEGKGLKQLGLLRKHYGYIRNKSKPEYQDTVKLAGIISSISKIMKKTDGMAIAFVARYGRPLSANNKRVK